MKKNKMMRLASFLLIAVLVSTSAISGTYAKYVTSDSSQDSARVAKFGVTIDATTDLFNDAYKDGFKTWTTNEEDNDITVQAETEDVKVVAPGTEGTLANFDIKGTPEVDTMVTYGATLTLENWFVDENGNGTKEAEEEYFPIVITVGTKSFYIASTDDGNDATVECANVAALKTAVEGAITGTSNRYHTGDDLSAVNDDLVVSWKWHFEGATVNPGVSTGPDCQTDAKDTMLGDQAAFDDGIDPATIKLALTVTITQID